MLEALRLSWALAWPVVVGTLVLCAVVGLYDLVARGRGWE